MIEVTTFTPWLSLFGGILIGLAAIMLMAFNGRIAGMTGILGGLLPPVEKDWPWRTAFIFGSVLPPALLKLSGHPVAFEVPISLTMLIAGGLIVGAGVAYGSGCTSGHGVCGIARFSPRSIVATVVFMVASFVTVFVIRHVLGG